MDPRLLESWRGIIRHYPAKPERNVNLDYLELCRRILIEGKLRRYGVDEQVISSFGEKLDIDLRKGFPLLIVKPVVWEGVVREVLWYISGSGDTYALRNQGVYIWDRHCSREYLDARGLSNYPEGVIGPCQGWQWRSFGSSYPSERALPRGQRSGVDQLARVISGLLENPFNWTHVITSWNPLDLPRMAALPCEVTCQFRTDEDDNSLSCQIYVRACDVGVDFPHIIGSYSLLTHLIAHIVRRVPSRLIICIGDADIFVQDVNTIRLQLERQVIGDLPNLHLTPDCPRDIDLIREEHIVLEGYKPQPPVVTSMQA